MEKHDKELIALLEECLSNLHPEVQKDYMINLLTSSYSKNKTVKELLESEVKAKHELEAEFAKRTGKI